jgi:hypothetical protein
MFERHPVLSCSRSACLQLGCIWGETTETGLPASEAHLVMSQGCCGNTLHNPYDLSLPRCLLLSMTCQDCALTLAQYSPVTAEQHNLPPAYSMLYACHAMDSIKCQPQFTIHSCGPRGLCITPHCDRCSTVGRQHDSKRHTTWLRLNTAGED